MTEDNEVRFHLQFQVKIFIAAIIAVTIIIVAIITSYHVRIIKMAELGYCETQVYGTTDIIWQKCGGNR